MLWVGLVAAFTAAAAAAAFDSATFGVLPTPAECYSWPAQQAVGSNAWCQVVMDVRSAASPVARAAATAS